MWFYSGKTDIILSYGKKVVIIERKFEIIIDRTGINSL